MAGSTGRIAAITDEFSPDLETALEAMSQAEMTGVELRTIGGRNLIDFGNDEIDRVRASIARRGMTMVCLASPLLKSVLPEAPPLDPLVQRDMFGSSHGFEDEARLADRVLEIAERLGARIVRVFSYWRTVDPAACHHRIVDALEGLSEKASARGLAIALENEHACNVGTAEESAHILAALTPRVGLIWDPANALILGERPYPDGYRRLPAGRIVHVHAKNCTVVNGRPRWAELRDGSVRWSELLTALSQDGYEGWVSLETHWTGPHGDKMEASRICAGSLRELVHSSFSSARE